MNTLAVKKDQMVVVLSGAHKGKVGKVLATLPDKGKVIVEGVNVIKKAVRKTQDNPKGGIISREAPIWVSKVMLQEKFEARKKKRQGATAAA